MATQPRFCAHCGAPLQANVRFCASCGQAVVPATAPQPAAPSYQAPPQVGYQGPPQVVYQSPPAYAQPQPARPKRRLSLGTILLLAAGVLLLLLLLARFVALEVAGETTVGTVTAVELADSEEYTYQVSYTFRGPDGARVSGNATLNDVLNVGTLPNVGDQVTVRYLPFWPAINQMRR